MYIENGTLLRISESDIDWEHNRLVIKNGVEKIADYLIEESISYMKSHEGENIAIFFAFQLGTILEIKLPETLISIG